MPEKEPLDATESMIETLHAARHSKSLIINPDYLDDEKLPEEERAAFKKYNPSALALERLDPTERGDKALVYKSGHKEYFVKRAKGANSQEP